MPPPSDPGEPATADLDAAIDEQQLLDDIRRLIEVPSITGDEAAAQHLVADIAARLGLVAETHEEDLAALRDADGYPGEEVTRDRLVNVTATAPGASPGAPRLCLSGHVDVVPPGDRAWTTGPFVATVRDGWIHGRGAADMKAGVVAALHAASATIRVLGRPPGDVVVHSVSAEEDGGLGAFAALRRDAAFAGCVIAEPTAGDVVCAHGGALTFRGRVRGVSAHAAFRLDGVSALDRFLPIHQALQLVEATLNRDVRHPLMRRQRLPYPLSIGRVRAGDWPSTVPDDLVFEGRVGVPVGMAPDEVRDLVERAVASAADDRGDAPELAWTGGQFAPAETDVDDPLVRRLVAHATAVRGVTPELAGAPYGSDMRLYRGYGVPTVMFGPGDLAQAHATDEAVEIAAVVAHARVMARLAASFGAA